MGQFCSTPAIEKSAEPVADTTIKPSEETYEPNQQTPRQLPKSTIKVFACRGLRNADWAWYPGGAGNVSDAYVICKEKMRGAVAGPEKKLLETKTIPNCLEPIFDEEFQVEFDPTSTLEFTVYDRDPYKLDDVLGRAELKGVDHKGYNGELELTAAGKNVKAYLKIMVKMPGGDYPPGPPTEFNIPLEKDKKDKKVPLGFEFDSTSPDILCVTCVCKSGPMKEYNDKNTAEKQMKTGQYIVAVNGVAGDSKLMVTELVKADKVELSMVRPHCFTIAIAKPKNGVLGLKLSQGEASNVINQVEPGPVSEWNKTYPDKEVKGGDRIVAVNGNRATGKDQMQLLKKEGALQIVISRRCPPPSIAGALLYGFWDWF